MALRLTGIPTPDDAAAVAVAQSGSAFGAQLRDQARLHLATGHLDRYATLLERARDHEDIGARYHARVLLLEEGLAAATKADSHALATRVFVAVAQAALAALEEEPREPVLLNLAGVALYELWSLDAAHTLFKAAQRLDPGLPHLRRNLRELGRRRKGTRPNKPLHVAVPGLAARARKIAPQARPAKDMTLSLCMIVRDEQEMLPRCLAAVAPAVDEIVIVDTGSTDRTVEIAHEFGAKVIEKEWTGSFSDARNVSFDAATGDWIIYLDADEVLVSEDVARLRALTSRVWREAFYLVETSYTGELGDGAAITNSALRVFRNRPALSLRRPAARADRPQRADLRRRPDRAELGPDRPLRLPRRRARRQGEVAPEPGAAEGPGQRERAVRLPALQPRHRVCGDRRPCFRARRARGRLEAGPGRRRGGQRLRARPRAAPGFVDARVWTCRGGDRARRRRPAALPRLHRSRIRPGARLDRPRERGRRDRLLGALPRDGRRPLPLPVRHRRRDLPAAHRAGRAVYAPRRARRGRASCSPGASPSTPISSASSSRTRRCCCAAA